MKNAWAIFMIMPCYRLHIIVSNDPGYNLFFSVQCIRYWLLVGVGRLCLYTNYHFFIPSILLLTSYGDNYVHYIIYDSFRNNRFVWWLKNHTRGTIKSGYLKLWRCGQSTDCAFELVLSGGYVTLGLLVSRNTLYKLISLKNQ